MLIRYLIIAYKDIKNIFIYLLSITLISYILVNLTKKYILLFTIRLKRDYYYFKRFVYILTILLLEIYIKVVVKSSKYTLKLNI